MINNNEPPRLDGPATVTIEENSPVGSDVDTIVIIDPDNNDIVELTLTDFDDIFVIADIETESIVSCDILVKLKWVNDHLG